MLPYRPPQKIIHKSRLSKPIPSIQLINTLNCLCSGHPNGQASTQQKSPNQGQFSQQENYYDSKNHVLTINNLPLFQETVRQLIGRSLPSFQRQLKKLGFKLSRKSYEDENSYQFNNTGQGNGSKNETRIYKWRGKKQLLIDQELSTIEKTLKQRKSELQKTRQRIKQFRIQIDYKIQEIIFSMLVDFSSSKPKQNLSKLIMRTKQAVNQSQLNVRKIVNRISSTLGNQLQLYKLLIYKQGVSESDKRIQQRQEEGEGDVEEDEDNHNENNQSQGSQQNRVIEEESNSRNSQVSIQVDNNIKMQMKQLQNNE